MAEATSFHNLKQTRAVETTTALLLLATLFTCNPEVRSEQIQETRAPSPHGEKQRIRNLVRGSHEQEKL
jgi:hypothetical protein